MARAVGIDLGTSNAVVAVLEGGEPTVIENVEGSRTTPSVVAFARDGALLVGQAARNQAVSNVDRTFRSVKRLIGSSWTAPDVDGKRYTAQEISARVLQKLKRDAEAYLGEEVTDAVITLPAYFDTAMRQATKEAGQIAGLNVLRLVDEPTAAALAYGLDRGEKDRTVLVFDLGGGTFDVSLLEIGEGVVEVKAVHGDLGLGGDDWDDRTVGWLVDRFKAGQGIDLARDKMAMQRLREAAERAKIELSSRSTATIDLPYIAFDRNRNPLFLSETLSRAEFQRFTSDLLDRTRAPFAQVVKDAGITVEQVDHVMLVGGGTRMPAVADLVRELLGGRKPFRGVNPDEVVAIGAAVQAGVLRGEVKDVLLMDVYPRSLGIETKGGVMTKIIERNTTIPTRRSEVFTNSAGTDGLYRLTPRLSRAQAKTVDLRELLEKRSAEEADGEKTDGEKTDVTEDTEETSEPAPFRSDDTSHRLDVRVFQGEREIAANNQKLGVLELPHLPAAPADALQIEVSFDIDANGIVNVSAKDMDTGKSQAMQITGGSALSTHDIDRMMRAAEAHAEEDRRRRKDAEVRNQAESLVYQTGKFVRENDEKLPAQVKDAVNASLGEAQEALKGIDTAAIKASMEKLATESQKLGAALYSQLADVPAAEDVVTDPGGASQAGTDATAATAAEDHDPGAARPAAGPPARPPARRGIFVCYRTADAGAAAGRLADHLVAEWGADRVFIDVDSVRPGVDYEEAVRAAIERTKVMLVVIGERWISSSDRRGRPRLMDPDDTLRTEIEYPLEIGVDVVPVLVDGAPMPYRNELPASLRKIATRNSLLLGVRTWRRDMPVVLSEVELRMAE